jgi:hypothetical protein
MPKTHNEDRRHPASKCERAASREPRSGEAPPHKLQRDDRLGPWAEGGLDGTAHGVLWNSGTATYPTSDFANLAARRLGFVMLDDRAF